MAHASKQFVPRCVRIETVKVSGLARTMKFDAIISNPPYNKGLLDRRYLDGLPPLAKAAARVRIDAAFVVAAYERHLAPGGTSVFLWPYKWTQLPTFEHFRRWARQSCLHELVAPAVAFCERDEAKVNAAITVFRKGQPATMLRLTNPKRHPEPIEIPWDEPIIPIPYGELGLSIHRKAMAFPHKLRLREDSGPLPQWFFRHGGAGGTDGRTIGMSNHIGKISSRQKLMASVISRSGPNIIEFESADHRARYPHYHGSRLYNFVLHQIKVDFNNTRQNVGMVPDVIREMEGEYSDAKAYAALGLTPEEIAHVESTVGEMPPVKVPDEPIQ